MIDPREKSGERTHRAIHIVVSLGEESGESDILRMADDVIIHHEFLHGVFLYRMVHLLYGVGENTFFRII
mgnify:CR=1 FL=1